MNSQHRRIRAILSEMSPERAEDYIKAFHLPEIEEVCIIEKEINKLSRIQICGKYNITVETLKRARRNAFTKIVDALKYREEKSRG